MTELNQKLLELIIEGKTNTEILNLLKITPKQLKNRLDSLKNNGYTIEQNISDDGKIKYQILKGLFIQSTNTIDLKLVKKSNEFTAIIVSDFHTGHRLDCLERIKLIYDYANKENINIIINCGDIIEGCCTGESEITVHNQIEKLIKNHPYDQSILNIICFGNHDYSPLDTYGINISNILTTERNDFISLGFGMGLINIKNGQIMISHPVKHAKFCPNYYWPSNWIERKVVLKGHGHHNSIKTAHKRCIIKVPTLSNIIHSQNATLPGAIKLTIEIDESGNFNIIRLENLIITDRVDVATHFKHTFSGKQTELKEEKILTKKLKRIM